MGKSLNYKKLLFCSIVTLLATNCGGGGGGGGSSAQIRPTTPSITDTKKINRGIEKQNVDIKKEENPKVVNREEIKKDEIKIPKELGEGVKIAILDGDFLKNKETLQKKYENINILTEGTGNGSPHGEVVLSILAQDKEKDFNIIAASIGKGDNTIEPSLQMYEKIFEKFDTDKTKVKIVNQSWGTTVKEELPADYLNKGYFSYERILDENTSKKMVEFFSDKVNKENTLFIWANGNYNEDKGDLEYGSPEAQLPSRRTDIKKGWLAVVGVNPYQEKIFTDGSKGYIENSHYLKHLAWPGGTAWWAISASGENLNPNDSTIGSSYAAPRVSRAAALVAEKYDWMTNSQVKQTLLTTTDKTEIEYKKDKTLIREYEKDKRYTKYVPDEKYGWGMLNTERALGGPGAFIEELIDTTVTKKSDSYKLFVADIPEDRISAFENDIRGNKAGLLKKGKGKLLLKGDTTYLAPSYIEDGVLDLYKSHQSNIYIEKDGTLVLHDKAYIGYKTDIYYHTANLSNEGRVEVFGKNTKATISGDYIATKDSVTHFEFGSTLEVEGTTKLQENKIEVRSDKYQTEKPEIKNLITSTNLEVDLSKVTVTSQGAKNAKLTQDGNKVIVEMARQNIVEYAAKDSSATESSLNVAANLENLMQEMDSKVEAGTATINELATLGAIQELSTTAINKNAEKLSGEIYASAQNLTFKQAESVNRNLSNHLGDLKAFKNSDYEWQGWVSRIFSDGDIEKNGYAKAKTKLQGVNFGIDKKINLNTQVGIAIDYTYSIANFNKYAGRFDSEGSGISLYGKKYLVDNYYLLGRVGVNRYSTKVKREILNKDLKAVGNGNIKHHDRMLSTYVETGKHFANFTPFIGYSYNTLKRGAFAENNADWGIIADSKNYSKSSLVLGIRGDYKINKFTFNGYLTHAINLGDRSLDFEGRFVNSKTNLKFKGIEQSRSITWVGIGLSKDITSQIKVNTNIDVKFNNKNNSESIFSIGLDYKF